MPDADEHDGWAPRCARAALVKARINSNACSASRAPMLGRIAGLVVSRNLNGLLCQAELRPSWFAQAARR
jgi:hypothetical protein